MKQITSSLTRLLLAFAIMCLPHFLIAQNITVKGKITVANGIPAESASISGKKSKQSPSQKSIDPLKFLQLKAKC